MSNLINRLRRLEEWHSPPQIEIWVSNEDGLTATNPQTGEVRETGDVFRFTLDIGRAQIVDDDL